MSKKMKVTEEPVEFLGKTNTVARGCYELAVCECLDWLRENRLGSDYAPAAGVKFEVLKNLRSCGNGDDLPVLKKGIWKCVEVERFPGPPSSVFAVFKSLAGRKETKKTSSFCVGYEPFGGHSIMAWKDNIRRVG